MVAGSTLSLFLLAVLVLMLSPGPNMAFVLSHGMALGPRGGLAAALGIAAADLLLSILSTVAACGASGVAGGSLLLIPMACSLFGISNDIAMQVVAVGFIIGVVQDSAETALNSSTDVLFTAAACIASGDVEDSAPQLARQNG